MNEASQKLAEALPMLEEATRVLKEIKKDDLVFLNSINKPTPTVIKMMELCCYMFSLKPSKENIGKVEGDTHGFFHKGKSNLLKDPNKFKEDLLTFDKENIKPEVVKKANTILLSPDITIDDVKSASQALLGIYKWAGAMTKYYELLKIVNPKREQVRIMKEKLKVVQAELEKKRKKLAAV